MASSSNLAEPPRSEHPRDYANPVDYRHPYESMKRLAEALVVGVHCNRTRRAHYRPMCLLHEHFGCDPEGITAEQLRDASLPV